MGVNVMDKGSDMNLLYSNPRRFARIAGFFYLLVFIFGIAALNTSGDARFAALTIGVLSDFGVVEFPINTLVLFGAYCIGLGWLTLNATFLPKAIGVLLIVAGVGWLTYIHPPLAKSLGALAMAPGMVGEGTLTIWLLAAGVDPERWRAQSTQSKT